LLLVYAGGVLSLDETSLGLAGAAVLCGLVFARLSSKPLTARLVQQTALARKRGYSPA